MYSALIIRSILSVIFSILKSTWSVFTLIFVPLIQTKPSPLVNEMWVHSVITVPIITPVFKPFGEYTFMVLCYFN